MYRVEFTCYETHPCSPSWEGDLDQAIGAETPPESSKRTVIFSFQERERRERGRERDEMRGGSIRETTCFLHTKRKEKEMCFEKKTWGREREREKRENERTNEEKNQIDLRRAEATNERIKRNDATTPSNLLNEHFTPNPHFKHERKILDKDSIHWRSPRH